MSALGRRKEKGLFPPRASWAAEATAASMPHRLDLCRLLHVNCRLAGGGRIVLGGRALRRAGGGGLALGTAAKRTQHPGQQYRGAARTPSIFQHGGQRSGRGVASVAEIPDQG